MRMREVAVLFARSDSNYKQLPGVDVWDAERDARNWQGGVPVVAHPPCRAWGRLRAFAKPRHDEKALALFAVEQVRQFGGVLEHPAWSSLWPAAGLPAPGTHDSFGGWTLPVAQSWFGHKAEKLTFLYVVGCRPVDLPKMPLILGVPQFVVTNKARKGQPGWRPRITQPEREHTPIDFALWLVELARRCE